MHQKPLTVSLLISTYNWKEALFLCLNSALAQTVLPSEIIIADDGSKDDTRQLIDELRAISPVPVIHVWHEDLGFRLTMIRNKAIAAASSEYIIQVDGDIILHQHFIKDHLEIAKASTFVCGSRVSLDKKTSEKALVEKKMTWHPFLGGFGYFLNNLRSRLIRQFLASRYGQRKLDRLRGCNMAFWKSDLITVNGYNELLTGWGHEDAELAVRLLNSGVRKRFLKMGGVAYHIWHPDASKSSENEHNLAIIEGKSSKVTWCSQGLSKHL